MHFPLIEEGEHFLHRKLIVNHFDCFLFGGVLNMLFRVDADQVASKTERDS